MPFEVRYHGDSEYSTGILFECIDQTEYAALTPAKQDAVRIILSCGDVNMKEGSKARTLLMTTVFPEGTLTYTNLMAVIRSIDRVD